MVRIPEGYDLIPEIVDAIEYAAKSGGSFTIKHSMAEAMALIVYPVWPFHIMEQQPIAKSGDKKLLNSR